MAKYSQRLGSSLLLMLAASSSLFAQEPNDIPTLAVGDKAVGFQLATFNDQQVSLDQYLADGKSVVLTFVRAHW